MDERKLRLNHNNQKKESDERPIIAAIYARVSSNNQVFGYSLDEQIRLARERCELMGWKVRYIFKEDGESGSTLNRPKFQMLMKKAEQRAFDVLVFWKLDRFCRSLLDVVNVEKQLNEYGVSLHSITEQIDTTTSVGRFNFRNIASAAEWERDMIKERSRLGMRALALQHKWPNKIIPLGYDKGEDGHLKVNLAEAKLVQKIFRRYIKINSMPQVAFELNKKGIKTKRGKKWSKIYIKRVLDNELYLGKYEVTDVEAYIKECKIISKKLFKAAKELRFRYREENKPMPRNRKEAVVERIFNEYLSFLDEEEQMSPQINADVI